MRFLGLVPVVGIAVLSASCPPPRGLVAAIRREPAALAHPQTVSTAAASAREVATALAHAAPAVGATPPAVVAAPDVPPEAIAAVPDEADASWGALGADEAPEADVEVAPEPAKKRGDRRAPNAARTKRRGRQQPPTEADPDDDEAPADRVAREHASETERDAGPALLASIARETWVYAEPRRKSRRIGYLRAGAVVERSREPVGNAGCKGGWYRVAPEGHVCLGRTATLDPFHPVVEASARRPSMDGLPYDYVQSRTPGPTLYARVPTPIELARLEPDLGHSLRKLQKLSKDPSFVPLPEPGSMPNALLYGRPAPGLADDKPRGPEQLVLGQARVRSGFALLSHFEEEGRHYGLTTDLAVVPLDRTRWVKPSEFHGLALTDEVSLPVAFVMKKRATRHRRDEHGRMRPGEALSFREPVALTGQRSSDGVYVEAKDGSWLRTEDVRVVDRMSKAPTWATGERKWVDVSILEQSLTAYEGDRPVYVTLVSTGADGLGDPKKTHSTIQGVFLVHTKHVTVTMDGDDAGDEFDLRDVPFVQYFTEGYALHGAYWHDDFGTPRSHGCVNLAPKDAAWLFGWTTPNVPKAWHAALSLKHGTVVYTHP